MLYFGKKSQILQSDTGILAVFTPSTDSSVLSGKFRQHLVCSVCYVNIADFFNKLQKREEYFSAKNSSSIVTINNSLNRKSSVGVENTVDVKNVKDKPEFILFYINFVSPSLDLETNKFKSPWL